MKHDAIGERQVGASQRELESTEASLENRPEVTRPRGFRPTQCNTFRVLVRPGDVGEKRTTMVDDMGSKQGRTSWLAEVYARSAPAGFRLAYLLTGDQGLAEDLVQEAFLRFVGRLHHLRDPEAFDAYLRRTIVNLSKDVFRRRAIERSHLERQTAELREGHTDRDVAAYESMRAALLSLSPRQRAAIVLRYYEDLHESEIADLLRCRPATVRSLVARGLEALRQIPEVTT